MSKSIRVVCDEPLAQFLESQAAGDGLSLSSYARRVLAAHRRQCQAEAEPGNGQRIPSETNEQPEVGAR